MLTRQGLILSMRSHLSVPLWFFAFVPYKLGEGLLITLLPLFIVQVAGGSVADVGNIHSIISLAGVVAFIFWGNLSDMMKRRRPFLTIGFLGFAVFTCLIALEQNVSHILLWSFLVGFLMAAVTPVASALVLDSVPEDERAESFSRFYEISGWSFVAGVVLGAAWLALMPQYWGVTGSMRALLLFAGGFASLSLILCLYWVKEPKNARSRRHFQPQLRGRLAVGVIEERARIYSSRMIYFILHPGILRQTSQLLESPLILYYLCSISFFFAIQIVFVPFPIFLTDVLKATNTQVLLITVSKAIVETFFYIPAGRFIKHRNGVTLQAVATGLRVLIFLIFATVAFMQPTPASLIIVGLTHLLTGITWAAINLSSMTTIANLTPKGQEGTALGVYNAMIGISTVVGSFMSGWLAKTFGYSVCFVTGAVLVGGIAVGLWSLRTALPTKPQPA
ncbi:MFS transporter [Microcoleus sp. FACHB-68]|uniref:MFS transporter n=1 Tax=Microcoleus sp. FACHB-68 TaxID=2692826 RepID=UPI00168506F5|nr:MFS transporter [Microcoleus sp. FACHB-68]MBD1939530.1 MFS transporter [Microcoleus sp. FACHB-68]